MRKFPLQWLLLLPFMSVMIISVSVFSWVAYQGEKRTIQLMVEQLVSVSNQHVLDYLNSFFEPPVQLVTNNALQTQQGLFTVSSLFNAPEKYLLQQNKLYPAFDDIDFAAANGAITGIDCEGDGKYVAKITTDFPKRAFYALDDAGLRGAVVRENSYDARTRDWFKRALAQDAASWSKIYVLKNKNQLGITAAKQVKDKKGDLVGVWGINITLTTIAQFLKALQISPNSVVYLVEKDSALVASSVDQVLFVDDADGKEQLRVAADTASNHVIAQTSQALKAQFPSFEHAVGVKNLAVAVGKDNYWVSTSSFKDNYGLNFLVVTAINENDFMGGVYALIQQAAIIFGLFLLLVMAVSGLTSHKITQPIRLFGRSAKAIADGNTGQAVNVHSRAAEIDSLEQSFNQMSSQLKQSFDAIQKMNQTLELKVQERTYELQAANNELTEAQKILAIAHKQIRDSIEYGSLIQHTLLPDPALFDTYFPSSFVYWEPKDTVGGDIYFLESLGNDDECFLMMIDCTGHGVPGAFVTMLVKAIERQMISRLLNSDNGVSPAEILSIFNKSMRHLLKQDNIETSANAGFDGCIVYLNKRTGKLVFSGAETSLFYRTDTQGVNEIKGNRHSIGYRQSDNSYVFTDHALTIESGMQVYLTTDGYLDQNGGEKSFPLGKKRFIKLVEACQTLPLSEQKTYFMEQLALYQGNNDRNDDVTLLSFRF
jgi:serine phosphatase RsbU (regulator of sigma subunit)